MVETAVVTSSVMVIVQKRPMLLNRVLLAMISGLQ